MPRENTLLRISYTGDYRDRYRDFSKCNPEIISGYTMQEKTSAPLGRSIHRADAISMLRTFLSRVSRTFRTSRKNHILYIHRSYFLIQSENYLQCKETCHDTRLWTAAILRTISTSRQSLIQSFEDKFSNKFFERIEDIKCKRLIRAKSRLIEINWWKTSRIINYERNTCAYLTIRYKHG